MALYQILYERYLPPSGVVMDIFGGTLSSAMALLYWIKKTNETVYKWYGCEKDEDLCVFAHHRLVQTATKLWVRTGKAT